LIRQDPIPSADALGDLYPADYRAHLSSDDPSAVARAVASLKAVQAELLVAKLRRVLPPKGDAILEIGCGSGHLLRRLRAKGFTRLHGVDRNPGLGPALEAMGIRFTACDIEKSLVIEDRYHTIILNNVIEHLADPDSALAACAKLLEPGGQILIFTPNTASLSHRVFRSFWSGLHAPRHVLLHCPSTFRAVARSMGFEQVDISFPADPSSWALSAQNFVEAHRGERSAPQHGTKPYALGLLPLVYPFALTESALGRGSSMLVRLARLARLASPPPRSDAGLAKPAVENQKRP
jgi:SAM-dependent methyltransferase